MWILTEPIIMIMKRFLKILQNKSAKYHLLILIHLWIFTFSYAQEGQYQFKQINIEDGLSQSTINCMLQDSKGYIWIGTANGLNRYDGYNFKVFVNDPLDSTTISDNSILSIFEDEKGLIWLGTVEGVLNSFDRKTGLFQRYYLTERIKIDPLLDERRFEFPLPYSRHGDKAITAIAKGKNNTLWLGTWGAGLINFNVNTGETKNFGINLYDQSGFKAKRIKSIISSDGDIWIGTIGDGIYKLSESDGKLTFTNFQKSTSKKSLTDNRIIDLLADKDGGLWIGTYGGGLNYLSKQDQLLPPDIASFNSYLTGSGEGSSISSNFVTALIQDSFGAIWIGTYGGGLNKFDPSKKIFKYYRNDPNILSTISKNDILSLLEDNSGNIWIGTHLGKGLNKFERSSIKFKQLNRDIYNRNGLNDDIVWAITEDDKDNIWIGTYNGGLNKWERETNSFTYYRSQPGNQFSLSDNHIRSLLYDDRGLLWIGTYHGGLNLYFLNSGRIESYRNVPGDSLSLGANQVQSIFIDSEKNVWIGTFGGGLNKVNSFREFPEKLSFEIYKHNPSDPFSLSDNRIYTIFEDSDGILWIGTFGGGLNRFDKNTRNFISYKNISGDESSLSDNRIMGIYEDTKKNLWISTYGGGLLKFDKKKERFTRYNQRNRLYSSVVYGVLEDNSGNLWMSSDNGLFKYFSSSELFIQYDMSDGLQSLEFSGGAYFKSRSGELFFGGINGINYFHPDSVKENYFIPPIVISSIRIFNEPVKGEVDSIYVSYDQNFLSIEFSALDYSNPSDNQYAYILEGMENEWHYVDARRRIVNYTNLAPGSYIFRVRGSNNDGVWNNVGTELHIFISPPYWQTWWFISLAVLFVAFVIYYLGTVRYRNLLSIEKLKSKLSADLHDNIGSGLTEISILSELASNELKSNSADPLHKVNLISEKARTLIDNMSDIVWMVNPHRDSLYHVILRLKDSYSDFLNSMEISFGTVNLEKFSSVRLPMDYKQNLFLIFKEAINNSIKHSNCKKIILEANLNKDVLELRMEDDGKGMDLDNIKYGNGILNMKSRAKLIGGDLEIQSDNTGTKIKFKGKISGINKFN